MKLEHFLENIRKIVDENPEALECDVVYSKDNEGNGFEYVHFEPALGNYDGAEFNQGDPDSNAICIN